MIESSLIIVVQNVSIALNRQEKAEQQVVSEQKVIIEVDCFLKKRRGE